MLVPLILACSTPDAPPVVAVAPVAPVTPPDVVLVTLDTTRADRIGAYGYPGAKTETIDELARNGIRFDHCTSPLPLTIPAHSTLMTGLLPYHTHVRANGDNVLADTFTTLAERYKAAGYVTAASIAAFVTTRQWGFSQGFDAYFDQMPEQGPEDHNYWHTERPGNDVVDDAVNWLAVAPTDKPRFLWVHLYDAHQPYKPVGDYATSFATHPYDGEVAFVDDQIQRLVDATSGRHVLWALIGDHGESLGQHAEDTHGLYAYEATARVPFILSGAGVTPGVDSDPVSSADLVPTLLRASGLPVPTDIDGSAQPGSPVVPYAESYQLSERFRLAPHRAVISKNLKLIATPKPELYDIAADPDERENIAATHTADVARLMKLLDDKHADPPGDDAAKLDAETVQQLASLGYVSGGAGAGADALSLPDPKDFLDVIRMSGKIDRTGAKEGPESALKMLNEALTLKPDAWELRMRKQMILGKLKRHDEAKGFADETAKMFPDKSRTWITLAGMAAEDKDLPGALVFARRAVELDPTDAAAQEALVSSLLANKLDDEGVKRGEEFMLQNAQNAGVAAVLGRYFIGKMDFASAERYLRIAVAGANPRRGARAQLAMLAVAAKARDDAYALLTAEVRDYPGNMFARRMLSRMYAEDQRWQDQKEHAAFMAQAFPQEGKAQMMFAQCLFNLSDFTAARRVLEVALKLDPEDPDILLLHANLLAKEGKRDEGFAVFQKATSLNEQRVKAAEAERKKGGKGAKKGGPAKGSAGKGAPVKGAAAKPKAGGHP